MESIQASTRMRADWQALMDSAPNIAPPTLDAILRDNLSSLVHRSFRTLLSGNRYQDNWHVKATAWHLKQVAEGKCKRLTITLPPCTLKSAAVSVTFPAWLLGRDPTRRVVCVSYGQALPEKHALYTRTVMRSAWYRRAFPRTRIATEKRALADMMTTARSGRLGFATAEFTRPMPMVVRANTKTEVRR